MKEVIKTNMQIRCANGLEIIAYLGGSVVAARIMPTSAAHATCVIRVVRLRVLVYWCTDPTINLVQSPRCLFFGV